MSDDLTGDGDGGARSDLFARMQEIGGGSESGLSAAQLAEVIRATVTQVLPDVVAGALARALPPLVDQAVLHAVDRAVTSSVADAIEQAVPGAVGPSLERAFAGYQPGGDDQIEPRLAALEDTLDHVGDRIEALTREGASTTATSLDSLHEQLTTLIEDVAGERAGETAHLEMEALRVDLANALEYVRETLTARFDAELGRTRESVGELTTAVDALRPAGDDAAPTGLGDGATEALTAQLDALHGRLDTLPAGQDVTGRLDALHARLDELSPAGQDVTGRLDALHARLDELSPAGGTEIEALVAALGDRLDALDSAVAALPAALPVAAPVPAPIRPPDAQEVAAAVEERLGDLRGLRDLGGLPDLAARLDALSGAITEQGRATADRVAAESERQGAFVAEAVSAAVAQAVTQGVSESLDGIVRAALEENVVASRRSDGGLVSALVELRADVQDISSTLDGLAASGAAQGVADQGVADEGVADEGVPATLAAIRGEVEELVRQAAEARIDVPLAAAVESEVDALRVDMANALDYLRDTVDARAGSTVERVLAELLEMRTDLATSGAETLTELVGLRDRPAPDAPDAPAAEMPAEIGLELGEIRAALGRLVERSDPARLADLSTTLAEVRTEQADAAGRLEALHDAVGGVVGGVVDGVVDGVAAAAPAPDPAVLDDLIAGQDQLAVRLEGLDRLTAAQDAVADRLSVLAGRLSGLDRIAAAQTGLTDRFGAVDDALAELQATQAGADDRVAALHELTAGQEPPDLSALGDLLAGQDAMAERLAGLDAVADRLTGLDRLASTQDGLVRRLAPLEELRTGQAEVLAQLAALDQVLSGQAWLADHLGALESAPAPDPGPAVLEALAPDLADLRERLDEMGLQTTAAVDAAAAGARRAATAGDARYGEVEQRLADLTDRLGEVGGQLTQLTPLAAAVDDHGQALERVADQVRDGLGPVGADVADLGVRIDALSAEVADTRGSADADRQRLLSTLDDLARARGDLAVLADRVGAQVTAATEVLEGASLEALGRVRADTERAVRDLRTEMAAARGSLEDHARSLQADVGEQARTSAAESYDAIVAAVGAEVAAVGAARTEIALIADRVQAAGRLVVGYLAERDVALEEVRDRVTVQLLSDLLDGMPRKDRARSEEQARGLLARRRDARQAERWREEHGGDVRRRLGGDLPSAGDEAALLDLLDHGRGAIEAQAPDVDEFDDVDGSDDADDGYDEVPAAYAVVVQDDDGYDDPSDTTGEMPPLPAELGPAPVTEPAQRAASASGRAAGRPAVRSARPVRRSAAPDGPAVSAASAPTTRRTPSAAPRSTAPTSRQGSAPAQGPAQAPATAAAPPAAAPRRVPARAPSAAPARPVAKAAPRAATKTPTKTPPRTATKSPARTPSRTPSRPPTEPATDVPRKAPPKAGSPTDALAKGASRTRATGSAPVVPPRAPRARPPRPDGR